MFELRCVVQSYAWGKIGQESVVAKLGQRASDLSVQHNVPYAELWMGDHPSGPAVIRDGQELLSSHIGKNAKLVLGEFVERKYVKNLPYLFKILSIAKSLSVQAHPDKELAEILFQKRPDIYKDPNHKPEMALALTQMQVMCGFRPEEELVKNLKTVNPLREIIGADYSEKYIKTVSDPHSSEQSRKEALRGLFHLLMTADDSRVQKHLSDLIDEVQKRSPKSTLDHTVLRVHSEFPGDVGVFSLYLLNVIELKPGEAVFLGPNEPHAYLQGDCVECMATSDNVVRAGLTPKFKDVDTLVAMLTYKTGLPTIYHGTSSIQGGFHCKDYIPPIEEFKIRELQLPSLQQGTIDISPGASIILVYQGEGKAQSKDQSVLLSPGSVIFVYAFTPVSITSTSETPLILYQATPNVNESKY